MDDFEHSDEHNATWEHCPNGDRRYFPDNSHHFDEFSSPAKLRQKGNYNYTQGKGWH